MKDCIIVTRHPALVEWLNDHGICGEVISHADIETVKDKVVYGVLPYSLSCHTKRFIEVSMDIPFELRGKELTLDDINECNPVLTEYRVEKIGVASGLRYAKVVK